MSHYRDVLEQFYIADCKTFEEVKKKFPDKSPSFLRKLVYLKGFKITEKGELEKATTKERTEKGLLKFVDVTGQERWITPQEAKEWKSVSVFPYRISTEQLGEQIADYILETSRESLLQSRQLRRLFLRFWTEKYPLVMRKAAFTDPGIRLKRREAEQKAIKRLEAERKPYLENLTNKVIQWGLERNLMRLTRADIKLFLLNNNIKLDIPSEMMLYREVKLRYRYLPPWMRQ